MRQLSEKDVQKEWCPNVLNEGGLWEHLLGEVHAKTFNKHPMQESTLNDFYWQGYWQHKLECAKSLTQRSASSLYMCTFNMCNKEELIGIKWNQYHIDSIDWCSWEVTFKKM